MKKWLIIVLVLLLSACSTNDANLEEEFDGLSTKEIISKIGDMSPTTEFGASVYDDVLVVRTETKELEYDMPEDEFYIAIAPYESSTHP